MDGEIYVEVRFISEKVFLFIHRFSYLSLGIQ